MLLLSGCGEVRRMAGVMMDNIAPPSEVTIEGVTYRTGFYGDLYPQFGQVGQKGSTTLKKELLHDDKGREFRRVGFDGHDWVHNYSIGKYISGTVYCAAGEWEQTRDYYADPDSFDYFCGVGYYLTETDVRIPEIDTQKFDELLTFCEENNYDPFNQGSNDKILKRTRRIPASGFHGSVCFFKVSKDEYFQTTEGHKLFEYDGRLLLVFYHDGGSKNGGREEVVALDLPEALGQYFLDLLEQYVNK